MKEMDIHPWLIRMSQGDEEAFQIVYQMTRDHAYRFIYYLVPNKQDVEDVMSEVYLELLRSANNYFPGQNFRAWFNGLIIRQVRNWKRKGWRRFRIWDRLKRVSSAESDRAAIEQFAALEDQLELLPIVSALPLHLKEVIVLRYYQDHSLEEIALLLQIPIGTVKSRHHRALKRLRHQYQDKESAKGANEYVY
ncbi:sigma-70 family RNA polymerase sigma factor [Paenibacillus arenosi]|uniref:Sigma-70 family RNA polymerase sigma factor n=1 Tax=Paenibacillus arenosi TaxID=2774142 RepID=A0ABR9AVV9_9BACL|nr:sigma-70 family RNA polymerase sigma factor [Paenibacillus arenosi]MBD8498011.1 sigma-70 family RNA polymerase sigma factor [Paenibacillus arenosi]